MIYEWFEHIEFKNQWMLPFLLLVPVMAWLYFRNKNRLHSSFKVTTANNFKIRTFKNSLFFLPFWLRLLAVACVILALARPQIKDVQTSRKGDGIGIILCLDVSGSMLSKDFLPNRLEVAKEVAKSFVMERPVDQIGLVVFAGESFTQFPISTDHEGLLEQIQSVKSGLLEDGTLIGEGLATSVKRLDDVDTKSKIIILLTDGKEEAPDTRIIDPVTALEITKAKSIKVYTIGMGSDYALAVSEMKKGQTYSKSTPFIDETLLKRIASQTGGQYFRAKDKNTLESIYAQIDRLEKSRVEVVTKTRFSEEFVWFILAALLFLAIEIILRLTLLRTFP